jgi:hypothetical protein
MIELQNKYKNKNAIIIFGGPSILENAYDLSLLSNKENIIFLESKALTPKFVEFGIEPHYYFCPYPEKLRTNSIQAIYMQALACNFELGNCLKQEYRKEWNEFKDKFNEYADIWRINYPHKKYRIKKDVILENSPLSLIQKFPNMRLLTYEDAYLSDGLSKIKLNNQIYKYKHTDKLSNNYHDYFNPKIVDRKLTIQSTNHINSSAISLYPILNFMGFEKVFIVGMDMSNLGSFEYSSLYTFKTMRHFNKFYNESRTTFSSSFPLGVSKGFRRFFSSAYRDIRFREIKSLISSNKFRLLHRDLFGLQGKFLRPKDEMKNCTELFNNSQINFINVCDLFKYSKPILGIKNISYDDFINNKQ